MKGIKLHGAAKRAVGRCETVRKLKDAPPGAADPTTVLPSSRLGRVLPLQGSRVLHGVEWVRRTK